MKLNSADLDQVRLLILAFRVEVMVVYRRETSVTGGSQTVGVELRQETAEYKQLTCDVADIEYTGTVGALETVGSGS
jgi:hypothetical protein